MMSNLDYDVNQMVQDLFGKSSHKRMIMSQEFYEAVPSEKMNGYNRSRDYKKFQEDNRRGSVRSEAKKITSYAKKPTSVLENHMQKAIGGSVCSSESKRKHGNIFSKPSKVIDMRGNSKKLSSAQSEAGGIPHYEILCKPDINNEYFKKPPVAKFEKPIGIKSKMYKYAVKPSMPNSEKKMYPTSRLFGIDKHEYQ